MRPLKRIPALLTESRAASPFARVSLIAYVFLIVYASWYPFSGWQADSLVTLHEALKQWPRYWTQFDAVTNVIGYMPLGILIVFSLYPWPYRWLSALFATFCGFSLSVVVESVQHFLPTRVTSLQDIATNSTGTLIGAILGVLLIPSVLEKGRLRLLQKEWLYRESSHEILVLGLWALAQIYPQAYLFGLGQVFPVLSSWISYLLDMDIDLGAIVRRGHDLNADLYLLAETFITALGCTGAMLMCLFLLKRNAPRLGIAAALLCVAIAMKSLTCAILFRPEYAFVWLTPGAQGGLLISFVMVYGFSFAPPVAQRRLAILMLALGLLLVNLVPSNPYFYETLQIWLQAKFLNFSGGAQFLTLFWPFIAIGYLIRSKGPAE